MSHPEQVRRVLPASPRRRQYMRGQNPYVWFAIFVGPFLLGLLVFIYVPIAWSAYLSLFDAHNTVTPTRFVGFGNYVDMFEDRAFRSSLITFTVFAIFIVPTTFVCSLGLALLVHKAGLGRAFFRSAFFLPTACSYVVAALVWRMSLFSGVRYGLVNTVLGWFGDDNPIPWLSVTHPPWYWLVLVTLRLWLQVGFYMVLLLAGLQRIPVMLYEAAALDGASGLKAVRFITLPQLRATSAAVLLLLLINAYQAFDEFYNTLATAGGYPPYARPPLVYLYYTALGNGQDFGHGSAGALILTALIAIVTLVQGPLLGFGRRANR